jgi:hypothetical protein
MKRLAFRQWAALALVAWLLGSCASVGPQKSAGETYPRFHDVATADLVLRFNTWDSIRMVKPDTREGGFLPLFARDEIGREVRQRHISGNTAVVVVSRFYREQLQIAQLSQELTSYLNQLGFRRVVILHAGPGADIDGLPVLHDSTYAGVNAAAANDEQSKVLSANAAVPAAVGADAANSSSPAIR